MEEFRLVLQGIVSKYDSRPNRTEEQTDLLKLASAMLTMLPSQQVSQPVNDGGIADPVND